MRQYLTLANAAILAAALTAVVLVGLAVKLGYDRKARVEISLGKNQTDAAIKSGQDAVATVASQAASETAGDQLTKENERDIRNAPGASAPVTSELHRAGLDSLCRRAAYRGSEQCLQHAAAK